MIKTDNPLVRAFELARTASCQSIGDIRRNLEKEGYASVSLHFESATLKKQLQALMRERAPVVPLASNQL